MMSRRLKVPLTNRGTLAIVRNIELQAFQPFVIAHDHERELAVRC